MSRGCSTLIMHAPRQVATLVAQVLHPPTASVAEVSEDGKVVGDAQAREAEARVLYTALEGWRGAAGTLHQRVQIGNCVYQHAAQVSHWPRGS